MNYITNNTTKRYAGNKDCSFNNFKLTSDDKYQYGCEFEFYINTDTCSYETAIGEITKEIYNLTDVDILVDTINLPTDDDKNHCVQIKPDISLEDNGIEISVPITTQAGIEHFIQMICPIIDKYGYANEETGFHIHISTTKKDGVNFNFYKYMLLCHNAGLLSSWKPRVGYSQNVMDILSSNSKQVSRKIKTKKGTIWNLEKIEPNHVEIKSIGGNNYHQQIDKMVCNFLDYSKKFNATLRQDTDEDKEMYKEHKKQLNQLELELSAKFETALSEAGIIDIHHKQNYLLKGN